MEPSSAAPLRVALIGAGRVGTAVCELLRGRGHSIAGVGSRAESSAAAAAQRLSTSVFELDDGLPEADLVLLGTSDDAIESTAVRLAPFVGSGSIVCHFAGALGVAPLAKVVAAGAGACALHPVQSCPDVDTAVRSLPGSAWGLTASAGVDEWAHSFVSNELSGTPVRVAESDRPLWHAAAVEASNGIAALLAASEAILSAIGVDSPQEVLGPLAAGTVANARDGAGGLAILTGPVVRGESGAIARHLSELAARDAGLAHTYALVARLILDVAAGGGRLSESARAEIDAVLAGR